MKRNTDLTGEWINKDGPLMNPIEQSQQVSKRLSLTPNIFKFRFFTETHLMTIVSFSDE